MTGTMNLVGYGISTIGPALAIGLIFAALINGIARQPEAKSALMPVAIIGFAVAEALAILGFVALFIFRS
ncbi:ATP synthase F0 subcomplex C subunit [Austwickia chelonae]|uniref:ATP synthase subunit c n=2 Tax=Austwickia TaxID=1184606 RepID=K6VJ03_9MICO|nr:ATP synthase subunit C [Austwickia chelonae]GAB76714.1 ATP synthase subunit c [Austwickia chelonae NBRC 105200]SEW29688.1 ATP synthase F0 subcomplex C subunit [Austwickia chelonae]